MFAKWQMVAYVIGGIYFEIKLITKPPITQQSADENFESS